MGFLDVTFLPSRASLTSHFLHIVVEVKAMGPPHFLPIVVEVKAMGPPHVLKLWLGVSKGMLPVEYFRSNRSFFGVS